MKDEQITPSFKTSGMAKGGPGIPVRVVTKEDRVVMPGSIEDPVGNAGRKRQLDPLEYREPLVSHIIKILP